MPQLNVSFLTSDPMLADCFTVIRRQQVMRPNGRADVVEHHIPGVRGVVTFQDPDKIMRREEGQLAPRGIFVATTFQMRGVGPGVQPDIILYQGTRYQVDGVMPWSRFGAGTYQVKASSNTAVDNVM